MTEKLGQSDTSGRFASLAVRDLSTNCVYFSVIRSTTCITQLASASLSVLRPHHIFPRRFSFRSHHLYHLPLGAMCFILTVLPIANNASSYFTPFGARGGIVGIYRTLNRRPHILTFNLEKHRLYLKHGFHRGEGMFKRSIVLRRLSCTQGSIDALLD